VDASDGPTGIQVFRENTSRIQAILLDLSLPGMPGSEVLTEIRKVSPKIPVIITTAYGRERVCAEVSEQNRVFYLQKPYGFGLLVTTLLSVSQANGA
jgi:DNA-binding response OmpR family regulator